VLAPSGPPPPGGCCAGFCARGSAFKRCILAATRTRPRRCARCTRSTCPRMEWRRPDDTTRSTSATHAGPLTPHSGRCSGSRSSGQNQCLAERTLGSRGRRKFLTEFDNDEGPKKFTGGNARPLRDLQLGRACLPISRPRGAAGGAGTSDVSTNASVLLTGASRGLGYALAEEYLEHGSRVVATVGARAAPPCTTCSGAPAAGWRSSTSSPTR